MATRRFLNAPGKLPALFALVGATLLGAVLWLGWRLIEQDRALESQRLSERLESAASFLSRELDRSLAAWEDTLFRFAGGASVSIPAGGVLVVFDGSGIARHEGETLVYHPRAPAPPEPPAGVFAAGEMHEFRQADYEKACAVYRSLARAEDRRLRAAALMRLARCLRKQDRPAEAAGVYAELATLGETPVAETPAELLARRERIGVYQQLGDGEASRREAALLAFALREGRFRIDRATFEFYGESLPRDEIAGRAAVAEAVEAVWRAAEDQASGRMVMPGPRGALVGLWRKTPDGAAALVAGLDGLMAPLGPALRELRIRLQLVDARGRPLWGDAAPGSPVHGAKSPTETGLPWTVRVTSYDPAAELALSASRRKLLSSALALILLAVLGASYAIFRAVSRELSVARLQSDFVAAVSHEFRTPLAAMCHLTELLEEGDAAEDRRRLYYRALGKETRRLRGMVESLLDFARMESGRQVYRPELLEAGDLVRGVVEEFREQAAPNAHHIELDLPADERRIRADREAISRALWNLLDNAVKYSPASAAVKVSVSAEGGTVAISVQDEGPGIPKPEQREVLRKFVRGSSSRALNIKGTGLGLAMVDHIVKAHGGRLRLQSEAGHGSRFTILLPAGSDQK
ncbi:MAG: HAMP domain-containing sensor histidine kinase [Acidobacteriota bacterium]